MQVTEFSSKRGFHNSAVTGSVDRERKPADLKEKHEVY
jgi:hypothetical protein